MSNGANHNYAASVIPNEVERSRLITRNVFATGFLDFARNDSG